MGVFVKVMVRVGVTMVGGRAVGLSSVSRLGCPKVARLLSFWAVFQISSVWGME